MKEIIMNFKEKIEFLFCNGNGRIIDLFYELFILLSSLTLDEQYEAFQYICENAKSLTPNEETNIIIKKHYTDKKIEESLPKVKSKFAREAKKMIIESSKANIPSDIFYKKIWDLIISNKICKSKHEKALATFIFVDDDFIPYIPVGTGISMEDEQFSSIVESFDTNLLQQTEMILNMKYDQKTQQASLLVEKLQTLNYEEQTVYLSCILRMVEDRIKEALKEKIDSI